MGTNGKEKRISSHQNQGSLSFVEGQEQEKEKEEEMIYTILWIFLSYKIVY
jgi:hypothetical protein